MSFKIDAIILHTFFWFQIGILTEFQPVYAYSIENQTLQSQIGNEDYSFFLYRIKADDVFYPALLLSNYLVLTVKDIVTAKRTILCPINKNKCEAILASVPTDPTKNYSYVKVMRKKEGDLVLEKYSPKLNASNASCVAIGYQHAPINVNIDLNDTVTCSPTSCHHLDGVICEDKIIGVVAVNESESVLLPIKSLLDYGNDKSGITEFLKNSEKFQKELDSYVSVFDENIRVRSRGRSLVRNFVDFLSLMSMKYILEMLLYL